MNDISARPHPRKVYEAVVQTIMPGCAGRALATRCQLMLMRDVATKQRLSPQCTDFEADVARAIERQAHEAAIRPMPDEVLGVFRVRIAQMARFLSDMDCENVREFWEQFQREMRVLDAALS